MDSWYLSKTFCISKGIRPIKFLHQKRNIAPIFPWIDNYLKVTMVKINLVTVTGRLPYAVGKRPSNPRLIVEKGRQDGDDVFSFISFCHLNFNNCYILILFSYFFRYANIFLHPVTEDIAPGYSNVVFRYAASSLQVVILCNFPLFMSQSWSLSFGKPVCLLLST